MRRFSPRSRHPPRPRVTCRRCGCGDVGGAGFEPDHGDLTAPNHSHWKQPPTRQSNISSGRCLELGTGRVRKDRHMWVRLPPGPVDPACTARSRRVTLIVTRSKARATPVAPGPGLASRRRRSKPRPEVRLFFFPAAKRAPRFFGGPCGGGSKDPRRSFSGTPTPHGLPPSLGVEGGRF